MTRALLAAVVLWVALAAPAWGAAQVDSVALPVAKPASQTVPPPLFRTNALQAIAIAKRTPQVQKAYRDHPNLTAEALVWQGARWEVDFDHGTTNDVEVDVGPGGAIVAVWTGLKARAYFARGNFGGTFDKPVVWLTFSLLFLAPFLDPRRWRRLLHLDLLVMLGFGLSYGFFRKGHINVSVPLVYPVLAYLLGRMLWIGFRGRRLQGALVPYAPTALLVVGLLALTGARVWLNVASDKVVDVGYASVVGADRVAHGQQLYLDNDVHGDTYGPINYVAYIPFEAVFPWHGLWDNVPAAHAAAITFDLLTIFGLMLLGMRRRAGPEGRRLGLALAWAWAAFPFTLFGVMANTNDGLVALALVVSLLVLSSPVARGSVLGLAAAAKFFPGALVAVYMRAGRGVLRTVVPAAAIFVIAFLPFIPPGGLREIWNCTLGFQLSRSPDFSLWGIQHGIGWTETVLEIAALGLVATLAFLPRGNRRSLVQVSALAAAATIALQIPAGHWFYFYIVWFTPLVLVALFVPES